MAPHARSSSLSRGLPWQPVQPRRHSKQRGIRVKGTFRSNMQGSLSAAGTQRPIVYARERPVAAALGLRPYIGHLSMPRLWQPAPPAVHGYSHGHAWPAKQQQTRQLIQQQQWQQQKQLKKRVRRARQRRQQRQRKAVARQQQKQHVTLFAPPAPLLDNEFYMARAERERQEQGVRQMDFFLYPAAAAAGAGDRQPVAMFAPAAPLITNDLLMACAEHMRAEAAALQQQQVVSSAIFAPLTPAAEEQPFAAGQAATVTAAVYSSTMAAADAAAPATPFAAQQWQQLEQQLQHVHLQEVSCSQVQQQQEEKQQQQQDVDDDDYTMEEVCSWFPGVQASLKSTQRVNLPARVASRQPDAPGFSSVLTRTVSGASSCC